MGFIFFGTGFYNAWVVVLTLHLVLYIAYAFYVFDHLAHPSVPSNCRIIFQIYLYAPNSWTTCQLVKGTVTADNRNTAKSIAITTKSDIIF